jgi:hypothetical protein
VAENGPLSGDNEWPKQSVPISCIVPPREAPQQPPSPWPGATRTCRRRLTNPTRPTQRSLEHLPVQEQQRAQRLPVRRRPHPPPHRQIP